MKIESDISPMFYSEAPITHRGSMSSQSNHAHVTRNCHVVYIIHGPTCKYCVLLV